MTENLLKEILKDEELSSKYKISEEQIKRAQLAPPFGNAVIEYLSVIIKAKMVEMNGDVTVYNKVKGIIK
jgi:hypothetical protein